ncbi:MAG: hypothetical protein WCV91_00855 [Candidatus Margulisiibacteriota bacterium]
MTPPVGAPVMVPTGAGRMGTSTPVNIIAMAPPQPQRMTDDKAALQCVVQLIDDGSHSEDSNYTPNLPPILRGYGYTWANRAGVAAKIIALYQKTPGGSASGKVSSEELWDVLRSDLNSDDKFITSMSSEALEDMFGGETTTLRNALACLTRARHLFAYKSDVYNFNSYREGKHFYSVPPGSLARMQEHPAFKGLMESPLFEAMERNFANQGLEDNTAEEEAKKIALTLIWQEFIQRCSKADISLDGLDMNNPVIAGRIETMLFNDQETLEGELPPPLENADIESTLSFLGELQGSEVLRTIQVKYSAYIEKFPGADPNASAFHDINFSLKFKWDNFLANFSGMTSPTVADMETVLGKMSREAVYKALEALRGPSIPASIEPSPQGTIWVPASA